MPIYRPSARVKLVIRLEEGTATEALQAALPAAAGEPVGGAKTFSAREFEIASTPAEARAQLDRIQQTLENLQRQRADLPADELAYVERDLVRQRDQLQNIAAPGAALPESIAGAPPDNLVVLGTILPVSFRVERNGLRVADTATVVLDWRDAPFDPRVIRSVGVEIIYGVIPQDDYAAGMRGQERQDGTTLSVVRRTDITQPPPEGADRFLGFADNWNVAFKGGDTDTITIECRDLTGLLLDTPVSTANPINLDLPIDQGVRELLDRYPATRGLKVVYGAPGERGSAPTPGQAVPVASRPRRGRQGGAQRAREGDSETNLWDMVTEICTVLGLVPLIVDDTLQLIQPRTFYAGRDTTRAMIYGRNISDLNMSRKLSSTKVPTVEIRCYDPDIGRTRWARYPVPGTAPRSGIFGETDPPLPVRANDVPPSGNVPDDKVLTYTLNGITNPATLAAAAESIFHQTGRQEMEGNFSTKDVWSWEQYEDGNAVGLRPRSVDAADLLRVRSGDPVEIVIAKFERGGAEPGEEPFNAGELAAMTGSARENFLRGLGWSQEAAERFARVHDELAVQTVFRVGNIRIEFDGDSGFRLAVDFINFLEIRELEGDIPQRAPSMEADELIGGRSDESAAELRRISGLRRIQGELLNGGAITKVEYDRNMADLTAAENRAVVAAMEF